MLRQDILDVVLTNPEEIRQILRDAQVLEALGGIGILPRVLELHAPSRQSRKQDGVGPTLCGRKGTRHSLVTCKQCLQLY
jgi:hypothetical protein